MLLLLLPALANTLPTPLAPKQTGSRELAAWRMRPRVALLGCPAQPVANRWGGVKGNASKAAAHAQNGGKWRSTDAMGYCSAITITNSPASTPVQPPLRPPYESRAALAGVGKLIWALSLNLFVELVPIALCTKHDRFATHKTRYCCQIPKPSNSYFLTSISPFHLRCCLKSPARGRNSI